MTIDRRSLLTAALAAALPGVASARDIETIKFHQAGSVAWVELTIGGRGPYRFKVDSGATLNVLRPGLAQELGLQKKTTYGIMGVRGAEKAPVYDLEDVLVGGVARIPTTRVVAAPNLGRSYDGLLGVGFLTEAPTEIDFEAGVLRRHHGVAPDWSGFATAPGERTILRPIDSPRLLVHAEIDGLEAKLIVDTAAGGTLFLGSTFVRQNRLWDAYPRSLPGHTFAVTLGSVDNRQVRCRSLRLGSVDVPGVVMVMHDPFKSEITKADGFLGYDVLKRFSIVIDTDAKVLRLKPNAAINAPYPYNRSGFYFLVRESKGFAEVVSLTPGGPAERAGVRPGDVLPGMTTVAQRGRLDDLFEQPAGTRVDFELERGGTRFPVSLVLEELL